MRDTQLQGWRRAGALPEVTVVRPARRGSESVYPEGTLDQARALCAYLERYRDLDKAVVLLWLSGHPIETRALRRAFRRGLGWMDKTIAAHRVKGMSDDQLASRVARAIVASPRRTHDDQATRRKAIQTAGGRQELADVYKQFVLLYLGAPVGAAGFLGAVRAAGWNLPATDLADGPLSQRLDELQAEPGAAGGLGTMLRTRVPGMTAEDFNGLRGFLKGMCEFAVQGGDSFGLPNTGFLTDCAHALGYHDPGHTR